MELYEGLLTRRSIRKYNPEKKLTKDEILELVRAASYAPSAHNKQPWHFLVIQDAETLRTLRQIQPWTSFAKDAACAIVVCADEEECFHREKEGWNYAQIDGSLAAAKPAAGLPCQRAGRLFLRRGHRCRWSLTTCVKSSVCRKRCSPWQSLPSVIRKKHPNSRKTGLIRKRCTGKRFSRRERRSGSKNNKTPPDIRCGALYFHVVSFTMLHSA